MTVHVFTGPTLNREEVLELVPEAVVHAPVGHGDLLRGEVRSGDVVVLIDGLYHQQAPVRHKEILLLLERGVRVVGCASMGALRAAELHECGMVGHGRVFEMYRDGEIDADDEVAVVHGRDVHTSLRNTPLVNVRWAAGTASEAGVLSDQDVAALVAAAQELHYTERSWRAIRHLLAGRGRDTDPVDRVVDFLERHPEHASLKRRDALDTLARLDELVHQSAGLVAEASWRNRYAYEWEVAHRGEPTAEGLVSDAELIRCSQLFSPEFPGQWRSFVIAELAPRSGSATDERGTSEHWIAALAVTSTDDLPQLTPSERRTLPLGEAMVRALVRTFESPRALHDLRRTFPQLTTDPVAAEQVRAALKVNAETWWRGREKLVDRLPAARLMELLAGLWECGASAEELTAAARDRGFGSLDAAVDAARTHFLAYQSRTATGQQPRWKVS